MKHRQAGRVSGPPQKLEMIVVVVRGLRLEEPGGLAPGGGLPVVLAFFDRDPRRERLIQIRSESKDIRLVHVAEFNQAEVGGRAVVELQTVLRENVADAAQFRGRKAVLGQGSRRGAENLR